MFILGSWVRFWVKGVCLHQRGRKLSEGVSFRERFEWLRVRFWSD
jgi:hypothetical protein